MKFYFMIHAAISYNVLLSIIITLIILIHYNNIIFGFFC